MTKQIEHKKKNWINTLAIPYGVNVEFQNLLTLILYSMIYIICYLFIATTQKKIK